MSIIEQDDYICQSCKKKGGKLEVDHFPKTFSEIFNQYKFKELEDAINCAELWDINNGRTLHQECHRS